MSKMTRWVVGAALAGAAGVAMAGNGENLFQQDFSLLRSQNTDGVIVASAPTESASAGVSTAAAGGNLFQQHYYPLRARNRDQATLPPGSPWEKSSSTGASAAVSGGQLFQQDFGLLRSQNVDD